MGFSKAGLRRIDHVLGQHREVGLVAGVADGDDWEIFAQGEVSPGVQITPETQFRISSMTKPITAAATLSLVEDGLLRLDDPVDGLLPELADRQVLRAWDGPLDDTVPAERPIRVRDCLDFTLGWGLGARLPGTVPILDAFDELSLNQGPPKPQTFPAPDEWIRRLGTLPLMFQPGVAWAYNTGSDVLSVLCARAAGTTFGEVLRARVFEPLGMTATAFVAEPGRLGPALQGDGGVYDPADGDWSRPPAFESGAAGLVSTVRDYLTFARALEHGGAPILSRGSVGLMTTDQLTDRQKLAPSWLPDVFEDEGFGFGVSVVTRRRSLWNVGTYGWDGGLGSAWRNDPVNGLSAVLLTTHVWEAPMLPPVAADFLTVAAAAVE